MSLDWKEQLTIACIVKDAVRAADANGVWQYYLPEVAATEEQVRTAERVVGGVLDGHYRDFLRHANGWKKALQNIDIHGTSELISEEARAHYHGLLDAIEDGVFLDAGVRRVDLNVIAGSRIEGDMFCIVKPPASQAGQVLWIAGTVVDRFPSFAEFFLALVDYNRRELKRLQGKT